MFTWVNILKRCWGIKLSISVDASMSKTVSVSERVSKLKCIVIILNITVEVLSCM